MAVVAKKTTDEPNAKSPNTPSHAAWVATVGRTVSIQPARTT